MHPMTYVGIGILIGMFLGCCTSAILIVKLFPKTSSPGFKKAVKRVVDLAKGDPKWSLRYYWNKSTGINWNSKGIFLEILGMTRQLYP